MAGAEVHQHTPVTGLSQRPDGTWDVRMENGDQIHAEHVVNAGGLWAREVGRMVGIELPVLAMEHHYLLTEDMPEVADHVAKTGHEMPMALDFAGEIYIRQEGGAMLLGTYEQDCRPWSPRETPWDFGSQLLKPDLDRIAPELQVAFKHYPAMGTIGIKRVVNGPFTFAPDGNPLVGPIRGLRGYWVACGVMAGLSQGGGVGLALATWMTERRPRRFGDGYLGDGCRPLRRLRDLAYTNAKVQENYRRRFRITFPNEELPAARPLLTTPIYDRLTAANAVWGATFGLEHALWFQKAGKEPKEDVTFHRSNAWESVAEEVAGGPRARRDDRDLELREVPGHRRGCRGLAVVAAHGPDAGARVGSRSPRCSTTQAGSSASSRSPDRPTPRSSTSSGRCRRRSTTRAGSGITCQRTDRSGSRCSAWA